MLSLWPTTLSRLAIAPDVQALTALTARGLHASRTYLRLEGLVKPLSSLLLLQLLSSPSRLAPLEPVAHMLPARRPPSLSPLAATVWLLLRSANAL